MGWGQGQTSQRGCGGLWKKGIAWEQTRKRGGIRERPRFSQRTREMGHPALPRPVQPVEGSQVPHLLPVLRKVGTTDARSTVFDVDAAGHPILRALCKG